MSFLMRRSLEMEVRLWALNARLFLFLFCTLVTTLPNSTFQTHSHSHFIQATILIFLISIPKTLLGMEGEKKRRKEKVDGCECGYEMQMRVLWGVRNVKWVI